MSHYVVARKRLVEPKNETSSPTQTTNLQRNMAERQLTAEEQQEKEDKERADKLKNTNGSYFFSDGNHISFAQFVILSVC